MFRNLGKRIILILSTTLSIFVVFTSITLYTVIFKNIYDSYKKTSILYTQQKLQNLQIYMKLAEEISNLLCNNQKIIESMNEQLPSSKIEPILDGIKSTDIDFSILGIALYTNTGISYCSSNITFMPSYEEIKKSMDLDSFIYSNEQSLWLVRDKDINETINIGGGELYKTKYGLLTFITKFYDKNDIYKGFIVLSVDILKLYSLFETQKSGFFGQGSSYVYKNGKILPYPPISKTLTRNLESIIASKKNIEEPMVYKNNIILYTRLSSYSDTLIITVMPMSPFLNAINTLTILITAVSLLFILYFVVISRLISKSISIPLSKLCDKMKKPI